MYNSKHINKISNIEAEKDVLASIISGNSQSSEIFGLLKPEHFHDKLNSIVYKTLTKLNDLGESFDYTNIIEQSETEIEPNYFYELQREVTKPLIKAMLIHDKWQARQLIKIAKDIIQNVQDSDSDIQDQTDKAISNLKSITDLSMLQEDITLHGSLEDIISSIQERIGKQEETLRSDYFPSFNKYTGGLRAGDFISLSGKDKAGKTTLAYSLALDFAINRNIPIGIFSLEMTKETLAWKAISLECEVEYQKLRNPNGYKNDITTQLTKSELEQVALKAQRRFSKTKIYTVDQVLNERQIKTKIKKWQKDNDVQFVVIDYIGLVPSSIKFDNREREIAYLSRFFKLLAHELKITLLVLSQQNRQGEIAESKGLDRDSDFAFSIKKPLEEGIQTATIGELNVNFSETDFLVTLERSRHSAQGKQFLATYVGDKQTSFRELELFKSRETI